MKRTIGILLAAALCALLAGCGLYGGSITELLRAPQLTGDTQAVQSALNDYLGQIVQLKYPNQGDFLTPFLFGDWDGDGTMDAAVLYQTDSSANVQIALLQKNSADRWRVTSTVEGLSGTVESIKLACIQPVNGDQILVGYATAGDKYLAVYNYRNGAVEPILQRPYSQYLVQDITGGGVADLLVLTQSPAGETQVHLLIGTEDSFTQLPTIGLPSDQFSGCAGIAAGVGSGGGQYLVLDGWTGGSGSYLASSVYRYDPKNRRMVTAKLAGTLHVYEDTLRYAACLTSRDLDGDGVVEIPVQREESGILDMAQGQRFSFVRWMDYTRLSAGKSFGVLDEEHGYYLELPEEWDGNLMLADGETGGVAIYNLSGSRLLLELRVSDESAAAGWFNVGMAASRYIQVRLGPDVTGVGQARLMRSIYML